MRIVRWVAAVAATAAALASTLALAQQQQFVNILTGGQAGV